LFYIMETTTLEKFLAFYLKLDFDEKKSIIFDQNRFLFMLNTFTEFDLKDFSPVNQKKVHKLAWLTNNHVYDVVIKCPQIEVILRRSNVVISKFLGYELVLSLMSKNFTNWEHYVMNHLNQQKYFRKIINKCFSKLTERKVLNKHYYLDKENDLTVSHFTEHNTSFNLIYTKDKESNNLLLTFKSYSVENNMTFQPKNVNFNFKHLMILENLKEAYRDINVLIRKLLIVDSLSNQITIGEDFFNYFDEKYLNYLNKGKNANGPSTLKINIVPPKLTSTELLNNRIITNEVTLSSFLLHDLTKGGLEKWKYIFWEIRNLFQNYNEELENNQKRSHSKTLSKIKLPNEIPVIRREINMNRFSLKLNIKV